MNIHYLQHIDIETPGIILEWSGSEKHDIKGTKLYTNTNLPDIIDFDWLFIMGGPMGAYEEKKYPWLKKEKVFIEKAIKANKMVIGICLGSQLIADVLGAKVYQGLIKEIGWHPVKWTDKALEMPFFKDFGKNEMAFHWHGDTFDMPRNVVQLAESQVYASQAFSYENNVFGFQFHLEFTSRIIKSLIRNQSHELKSGPYIQSKQEILSNLSLLERNQQLLSSFLSNLQ